MRKNLLLMMILLLCATGPVSAVGAVNTLEVVCDKNSHQATPYSILMAANKIDALTCSLATGADTYALAQVGDEWFPEQRYLDDHTDLTFAGMTALMSMNWVLTWDAGEAGTETTCTIDFGTLYEVLFPLVATVTMPVDGLTVTNPDPNPPTIVWNYGGVDPCVAVPDYVAVNLYGPEGQEYGSGEMPCETLYWIPPSPLGSGQWTVEIHNETSDIRMVPDGLTVTGDAWVFDNSSWLGFRALAVSVSDVVPTTRMSFGNVKALYR